MDLTIGASILSRTTVAHMQSIIEQDGLRKPLEDIANRLDEGLCKESFVGICARSAPGMLNFFDVLYQQLLYAQHTHRHSGSPNLITCISAMVLMCASTIKALERYA